MSNAVLLQLNTSERSEIVGKLTFLTEHMVTHVFPHVSTKSINSEAHKEAKSAWISRENSYEDAVENAFDAGISKYELLVDLKKNLLFGSITTLFHILDKDLRIWLTKEVSFWSRSKNLKTAIWAAPINQIFVVLKCFGYDIRLCHYFEELHACQLLVNAFKHGNGPSLDQLKQKYPKFFRPYSEALDRDTIHFRQLLPWDHSTIEITVDDFLLFSEAIQRFWHEVPMVPMEARIDELPKWFRDAI